MKSVRQILALLLYCLCAGGNLSAQNEGKEFWFTDGFLGAQNNYYYPGQSLDSAIFYVLGQTYCTGYIENPYTSYHVDFEVQPGVMTKVLIPEEVISSLNYGDFVSSGGGSFVFQGGSVVIRTTKKVQVWVQSYNCPYLPDTLTYCNSPISYDGPAFKTALYPTDMHSTSYDNNSNGAISNYTMFVIAPEDNTQLYIGSDTVMLNQGEVYCTGGCNITTNCKRIICI